MKDVLKKGSFGEEVKQWQLFLQSAGYKVPYVDGAFGPITERETLKFQAKNGLKPDGVVGPKTWKFITTVSENTPLSEKWPKQDYTSMVNFYGPVGENTTSLEIPYPMKLAWAKNTVIKKFTCHQKCAKSFYSVFEKVLKTYGEKEIERLGLNLFGGVLNVRKMRGGSSWSTHCLPAGSPIWTPEGVKSIEDIQVGDNVYSYREGTLVENKVTNFWSNGYKKITTIKLNGGILECSPEHKILVLKKETLHPSQYIQHKDKNGQQRARYWTEMIEAQNLEVGDKVVVLKKKINSNHIKWDLWFEILGMFIGDGCIHHRHGKPVHISFQIPKSDRIRKHAENILIQYFGKENLKFDEKQILSYRSEVFNKFLSYNKKSYDKTIPKEIWSANFNEQLSFIRGYIYTDGCVIRSSRSTKFVFKCASFNLMKDLRLLLCLNGFANSKLTHEPPHKSCILGVNCSIKDKWGFNSRDTFKLLTLEEDHVYKTHADNSKPNMGTARCQGYEIISPDFIYKSVKSIKTSDVQIPVYDIEVDNDHNFIVDGIVVSNSWGCAIDIDPDRNQLRWGKDRAKMAHPDYNNYWKFVEDEGGVSLGRQRNMDYQHWQFARL